MRSRAEIPSSFASEDEEREWWATHELADELLPDEETIDRMTDQHRALLEPFRPASGGVQRPGPLPKRERA